MSGLIDFLNFRWYLSPYALLVFYYTGALLMPLMVFLFWQWLKIRFAAWRTVTQKVGEQLNSFGQRNLSRAQRIGILLLCILCFLMAELFWRMMFEFMIAYFNMASDLQKLVR